jgi:hypothetical protein
MTQPAQASAGRLFLAMPGTATFTLRQRHRSLARHRGPATPGR